MTRRHSVQPLVQSIRMPHHNQRLRQRPKHRRAITPLLRCSAPPGALPKRNPSDLPLTALSLSAGLLPVFNRCTLQCIENEFSGEKKVKSLIFLLALPLAAQESIQFSSVGGRVTDPSGAVVEGASVKARQTATNLTNETVTGKDGRFRLPYLKPGTYEITVNRDGFTPETQKLSASVGSAFELPFILRIAGSKSDVTVSANSFVLEAARSQIAGTVSQQEVAALPLLGRNFLDLALLVPGVSPTNTASAQLFAETSAVPGQGISIASQRNFSNSFIVDGLSTNDDAAGLTGTFFGLDVVNEFQVVTSGGQAEFGRAIGGYINMVTKSGGNDLHGDLYGYFRNQRFNADNALTNTKLPLTQAQYGASISGPIRKDRTFYFANFEQRELNQSGSITIAPANISAINSTLVADGYKGSQIYTGLYSNPVHNTNFLAKLDHQFSTRDQFSLRYSLYDVASTNSRGAGALSATSAAAGLADNDESIAVSNIYTLSPRTVNETRGQFTRSILSALPNDPTGPAVSISGVASFGTLSGSPTGRLDKMLELVDNFSHQAGAHAFRAGIDYLYNDLTITFPQSIHGSYAFSSLANFQKGIYSTFTQSFGTPVIAQTNPNTGFYVQDEWKLTPNFTINYGVRYDLQFLKIIATDTNNLSPRAGFAWTPFRDRKTVLRGSYGIFYDRIPLRAVANALLSSGNTTTLNANSFISVSLSPTQTGAPAFPAILNSIPSGVLINYSTMNPHMQNAESQQGSFEIEHQLSNNSTLAVSYQHLRGLHLLISVNENVPTCAAVGTNNGCRPNPNFGNNKQYSSLADSHYDGLQVSFIQRPVKWGNYRISYTYSKALDNVGEFFFSSPVDNFNIWKDYGRSDDDQRHRVVVEGTANLPFGLHFGGALQYYSALPFNITTGANTVQTTAARPTYPDGTFIPRNFGTGFDTFTVNTRLTRSFQWKERWKMMAILEAFNTLNHRNNLFPNGTFGTGTYPSNPNTSFGQPTAVGDPRSLQLGLRFSY